MSNGLNGILSHWPGAQAALATLNSPGGDSLREKVAVVTQQLRDDVAKNNFTAPNVLDSTRIARDLARLQSGRVAPPDGSGARELAGTAKYETYDPRWIECLRDYVSCLPVNFPVAPPDGAIYPLADDDHIKIALAGDWGTNNDPSNAIAGFINTAKPDYTVHLGDVYYAGEAAEEADALIKTWPRGRRGTFALNSNHEMYSGGAAYFDAAKKFSNNGFSYFALQNKDWLIVGLDTAYWAQKQSFLYQDGYISDSSLPDGTAQENWLKALLGDLQHAKKRLMIMTHHDGFDVDVGIAKQKNLLGVLTGLIANRADSMWYWGHVHAGIAYNPVALAGSTLRARCVGHGGIPYPPFETLSTYGDKTYSIAWAEKRKATTGDLRRAPNGYMMLTLTGKGIEEEFFDENGALCWSAES